MDNLKQRQEKILEYFTKLCKFNRPSHKELECCKYLLNWFQDQAKKIPGMTVETFQGHKSNELEGFDIIAEIPATKGYENKPKTLLQSHIDMVWVTRPGHENVSEVEWYIDDNNWMHAKYSTLGSDDGMGIAQIQYIIADGVEHGPLRIILTTDEEQDMTGARFLPNKYLQGCKYCFNIDGDYLGEGVISSAAVLLAKSWLEFNYIDKPSNFNIPIYIKGTNGLGGHSGEDIGRGVKDINTDKGRANIYWWTNQILLELEKQNIENCLSITFQGTTVETDKIVRTNYNKINSVPKMSETILYLAKQEDVAKLENIVKQVEKRLHMLHPQETEFSFEVITDVNRMPQYSKSLKVFANEDKIKLINLVNQLLNGLFKMSRYEDVAQESSNTTMNFEYDKNTDKIKYLVCVAPRCAHKEILKQQSQKLINTFTSFGIKYQQQGFEVEQPNSFLININTAPWTSDQNSEFCQLIAKQWKLKNGTEYKFKAVHGGLECAYFYDANPELEIISLGVRMTNCHTVDEAFDINSINPTIQLIIDTLQNLPDKK